MNQRERIGAYVRIRDKKAEMQEEFKIALKPLNEALLKLDNEFLEELNDTGAEALNTKEGTVYKITRASASVQDRDEFLKYVFDQENLELLDVKANKTVVRELALEGVAVPGVKYSESIQIGVRRGK